MAQTPANYTKSYAIKATSPPVKVNNTPYDTHSLPAATLAVAVAGAPLEVELACEEEVLPAAAVEADEADDDDDSAAELVEDGDAPELDADADAELELELSSSSSSPSAAPKTPPCMPDGPEEEEVFAAADW